MRVLALQPERKRAEVFARIGKGGLGYLEEDLQRDLVDGALALQDEVDRATALAGIGKGGLQGLPEDLQLRFVAGTFGLGRDGLPRALKGIGDGGRQQLPEAVRRAFVENARELFPEERAPAITAIRQIFSIAEQRAHEIPPLAQGPFRDGDDRRLLQASAQPYNRSGPRVRRQKLSR
jgi:hypothetical protein